MDDITTRVLRDAGWSARRIARSVLSGELVRVRRGHYAPAGTAEVVLRAVRIGGRLGCVSELRHRGIWVLDDSRLHVLVREHTSDLRDARHSDGRLRDSGVRVHWHDQIAPDRPGHASIIDALADASKCLERRGWIASVDSAIRLGHLRRGDIPTLACHVNAASRADLAGIDPRAESGLESIVRMLARDLGFRVRSQVSFAGVGRVDLLVEEWIVVETDGTEFHGEARSPRDRRRDATLSAMNRTVLRPGYSLVVHDPSAVARQLIGAVATHRRVRGSGELAARARIRARRLGIP